MNMKKLICGFLSLVVLQIFLAAPLFARSSDYTVIEGKRTPIPQTYIHVKSIYNVGDLGEESGYFKEPQDLYINRQDELYVADTGNNRIIKLSADGEMLGVFKGDPAKPLLGPEGIFADEDGDMYVADTKNSRIVHLSAEGQFVEAFVRPESDLLRSTFTFSPTKLLISPTGYIYTLRGQNIMTVDANNRFRGFFGQTEIGYSFLDALIRMFASDEQKNRLVGRSASVYTNITIDEKGVIYATSLDPGGEIKKLNALGTNIYRGGAKTSSFVETFDNMSIVPNLVDIAVDREGIITVLEANLGKLYQYDQEGNLLTVFGGIGEQKGKFAVPVSVANDSQGNIYVLDRVQGSIDVFAPTQFIKLVHQSIGMYDKGEYDSAYRMWSKVLTINENYRLAHAGLAKALYKQGNWKEAMAEFKFADDRAGYSKAYAEYRYEVFRQNFVWVVLLIGLAIAAVIWIVKRLVRISEKAYREFTVSGRKMGLLLGLSLSFGVIFHPIRTFEQIVNARGRLNYTSGWIILLAVLVIRIFYLLNVHYPLENVDVINSNIWMEALKLLLPPLTWIIASFYISAILDGESKVGEIFIATCFSMVPYILITGPLALVSNVLSLNEQAAYEFISNGAWIWILALFFLSLKVMNDYTLFRTTIAYAVSGITMVLMWFVGMLGYVLTGRLYQFVDGIAEEVRMTWF